MSRSFAGGVMAVCMGLAATAATAEEARDPFGSEAWSDLIEMELAGGPVVYDDTVLIFVPDQVDEAFNVPLIVSLSEGMRDAAEIVVVADNNPLPIIARIYPHRQLRGFGMNIRLEQTTAVRVAAMDGDGVWHVAHGIVNVMTPGVDE